MRARHLTACLWIVFLVLISLCVNEFRRGNGALAAAVPEGGWLTGDSLRTKLGDPIGVSWSGSDLRRVCESLVRSTRICLVLDRRVDPSTKVEWSSADRSLGETMKALAEKYGCGLAWIGPVAYLGPPNVAQPIPEILEARRREVDALPQEWRTKLLARRTLEWADLAEPRGVLERQAAGEGLRAVGAELVPFDLMYRMSTPPLTFHERLTLITVQFDLTYRLDIATGSVVFEKAKGTSLPVALSPSAKPGPVKTNTVPVVPNPNPLHRKPPAAAGTRVFTLKVQDVPLDQLIDVLRRKHGLSIRVDEEAVRRAGLTLDRRTSVDVKEATLEALLEQAAAPLGLGAKRVGDAVEIGPAKK